MRKSIAPIYVLVAVVFMAIGCANEPSDLEGEDGDENYGDDGDDGDDYYDDDDDYSGGDSDSDTDSDGDVDGDSDSDSDGDWSEEVPGPNEGDSYEAVGTNPFVYTGHDPFSTFAADVDTASYDIFRRDIEDGFLPQPASVRLEEYVNYFSYDYPFLPTRADHPFSISLTAAPGLSGYDTTLLRVGIQGKVIPASAKPPANLVFLADVSGSMTASDKLPLLKHLLTTALDYLDEDDMISIVTYASGTGVALSPTPVSERDTIEDALEGLAAGGSTSGAAGLDLAYSQAESAFIEGGINHVLLCTDGDFNVGPSSTGELVDFIVEKRETGITLTVLGFGTGNLNDTMMESITNAGNGTYAVISSTEQADEYAESRLLSDMMFIAKDVKLQVEFNPEFVLAYRLLGYENRELADDEFVDDTIDAGEVGSGHRVTAFYEVVFNGQEVPQPEGAPEIDAGDMVDGEPEIDPGDMVLMKVRYKHVDAAVTDEAYELRASMTSDEVLLSAEDADSDFRWAASVAAFAEIIKESPFADEEALDAIEDVLLADDSADSDRVEFLELFQTARTFL